MMINKETNKMNENINVEAVISENVSVQEQTVTNPVEDTKHDEDELHALWHKRNRSQCFS